MLQLWRDNPISGAKSRRRMLDEENIPNEAIKPKNDTLFLSAKMKDGDNYVLANLFVGPVNETVHSI